MTQTICVLDKANIETFLRHNPILHLFGLGDLDDFYWPYTGWYALEDNNKIQQLILTYSNAPKLIMMALAHERIEEMRELLHSIIHLLPQYLYVHVSGGLADVLTSTYHLHSRSKFLKMALTNLEPLSAVNTDIVIHLTIADLPEIEQFYQESYPRHGFNARMLQTGQYFGMRQDSRPYRSGRSGQ